MKPFSITKHWTALTLMAILLVSSHRLMADTISVVLSPTSSGVLGPSSDSFSLDPGSVTVTKGSGTFILQNGGFHVDYSNIPDQNILFTIEDIISWNGVAQTVTLRGQVNVTSTVDTLTLFEAAPFSVGDMFFTVQPLTVTARTIGDYPAHLIGEVIPVVTPEPGSIFLLGTGLLVGAVLGPKIFRLRKKP